MQIRSLEIKIEFIKYYHQNKKKLNKLLINTLQRLNYVNIFFVQINITKFKMSIMAHHFKYFIYEKRKIN
ncbi:hypothetical protein CMT92_09635 [Elizabethkingia anophelis]|nr:hypothetical protein [Elizabethkingia anophelis]